MNVNYINDHGRLPVLGIGEVSLSTKQFIKRTATADAFNSALVKLRKNEAETRMNLACYTKFFESQGHTNPLEHQLNNILKKGINPKLPVLINILLLSELSFGVLMGVQDAGMMSGALSFSENLTSDSFEGMKGIVTSDSGDFVLKDELGIIASYFHGPDKRTQITDNSEDLIFFAFSSPGIDQQQLEAALAFALQFFSNASISKIKIFK